jgi:hypothetical protein
VTPIERMSVAAVFALFTGAVLWFVVLIDGAFLMLRYRSYGLGVVGCACLCTGAFLHAVAAIVRAKREGKE